jgi:hypothetical protein
MMYSCLAMACCNLNAHERQLAKPLQQYLGALNAKHKAATIGI